MAGGLLLTSSRAHTHTRLVVPTTSQHQPTSQDSQEQGPRIFGWRRPCFGEAPLARFREKQAQEGLTSSSKHTWEKAGGIPFFAAPGVSRVSRWAWHAFAISLSLSLSLLRFFALAFGEERPGAMVEGRPGSGLQDSVKGAHPNGSLELCGKKGSFYFPELVESTGMQHVSIFPSDWTLPLWLLLTNMSFSDTF